jgi:hypothetical protein
MRRTRMKASHLFETEKKDGGILVDVSIEDIYDDGNPRIDVKLRDKDGKEASFYFEIQDGIPILRVWPAHGGEDAAYTINLWGN